MERRAPPAAPGWPSGCTFPEVELPGGQSSQANKYKRNSESETNSPYIVVGTFEGLCPSNTFAGLPDTPSLEGAYEQGLLDGNLGQMASFQSNYKRILRIEVPVWPEIRQAVLPPAQAQRLLEPLGPSLPLPRKGIIAETQRLPHKRKHKTTRPQSLSMQLMPMRELRRKRMRSLWRRRDKDASPFGKVSYSEPRDTYAARCTGNKYEVISKWLLTGLPLFFSRPNWQFLAKRGTLTATPQTPPSDLLSTRIPGGPCGQKVNALCASVAQCHVGG